jgi:hypothetical protein
MLQPLIIARQLGIPTFAVFDADADQPDKNGSREKHRRDNEALLRAADVSLIEPLPQETLWAQGLVMWKSNIGDIVQSEIGAADWSAFSLKADALYGQVGNLQKNALHIAAALAFAWDAGKRARSLEKLCASVLDAANSLP